MNNDLISRSALTDAIVDLLVFEWGYEGIEESVKRIFSEIPAVDAVSREVVEQIMWERDTAIKQLEEHGIPFGGIAPDVVEVVRCKDCVTHGNCLTEDTFRIARIDNPFCCGGKRRADE